MRFILVKLFSFIFLMMICASLHAQNYDTTGIYNRNGKPIRRDTTNDNLKHRDAFEDSITISFHYWDSTRINKIDSSINDFYTRYPVPWSNYDLGNFGTASKSFIFQPIMQPGFDAGFHAYDIYRYTLENTKFYTTTRPYSETVYLLGSRAEQMINLFHTQNKKSNFNIGLDFKVISSPGGYKNQSTNISNGRINTFFQTNNKRYINNFIFITNKILSSDNGGVQPNQNLDSLSFNDPRGLSTKIGNGIQTVRNIFGATIAAGTQYKEVYLMMRHSYDFGQKDSLVTDSVTYKLFYPRLRLQHTVEYSKNAYEYHDYLPVDSDYSRFYNYLINSTADTIKFNDTWSDLTNDFAIISYPQKNNLNQFLKLNAGLQVLNGIITPLKLNYTNAYAGAEYRIRTRNQLYDVVASGKLYLAGHYAGDYEAYISLQRSLRKNIGSLQIGFQNINRTPSFMASEFTNDSVLTDTLGHGFIVRNALSRFPVFSTENFKKENITKLFAVINIPPASLQLGGEYYLLTNYTYFNGLYSSTQSSAIFNVLHVFAQKKLGISKYFNLYLDGHLQKTAGDAPIHLPLVLGRGRFAFEGNFFKNLFLSTGLEVRYNTPYKADNYSPLTGQFFPQDTSTISNLPDVNLFFDFRIKSFKGFVRLENLNTVDVGNGFSFTNVNFSSPGYAQRALWLRIGIWWSFVN